eukprot:TRINITY_DN9389_c0_g1_i1.p1 TRINITY_DN9389_c0_g1~~TRINITY_DN9389_c0_g1_i1.p1  ORF type:complete len:1222 (-),score=319.66 TRINITY_DN9389_c0_g1_i1:16-3654(-)
MASDIGAIFSEIDQLATQIGEPFVAGATDVNFRLIAAGSLGEVAVISQRPSHLRDSRLLETSFPPSSTFGDAIPAPVVSNDSIERDYLSMRSLLLSSDLPNESLVWPRPASSTLMTLPPSQPQSALIVSKRGVDGAPDEFAEVQTAQVGSARTSTSMQRAPGSLSDYARGSTMNIMFRPGGLEDVAVVAAAPAEKAQPEVNFSEDLLTIPPGFTEGMTFDGTMASVPADTQARPKAPAPQMVIPFAHVPGAAQPARPLVDLSTVFANAPVHEDNEAGVVTASDEMDEVLKLTGSGRQLVAPKSAAVESWAVTDVVDVSNFKDLVPNPAIEFPFELDVFQKQAVYHLENGDCVFVAAHTSAGKTVVAEYAIALAAKHMTKTIYTSPIKALSNQKFRDFKTKFGDVGLITGDVTINPDASCLIMTTEILRTMLYKGADLIRDVEWVIFDEVHYVNDIDRGVVWEEVIIMLPAHVGIIMLSATVPNVVEFAEWTGRTKKKRMHVCSTHYRPVPLEHYLFSNGEMFKLLDSKGAFLHQGYRSALLAQKETQAKQKPGQQQFRRQENPQWSKLITTLKKQELLPAVVFMFSKKRCEETAYSLTGVDLTTEKEKHEIHVFCEASLSRLRGPDRTLPQVVSMRDILSRGIGIHHGGLLPLVKEMVEMLFGRGLVRVLFATETFAMGINMPARCVVYSGIRKNDGRQFRELLPGEYTQMSGRAGRRGLDTVGTVIITCWGEIYEESILHQMMTGTATRLQSQFRLSYNMILNLLRVEDMKVEEMIKRSFSEFGTQAAQPGARTTLADSQAMLEALGPIDCIYGEPDIENFHGLACEASDMSVKLRNSLQASRALGGALCTGRVVMVVSSDHYSTIGVILRSLTPVTAPPSQPREFSALIGVEKPTAAVIVLDDIVAVYKAKIKVEAQRVLEGDTLALAQVTQHLQRVTSTPLTALHPMSEMGLSDMDDVLVYQQRQKTVDRMLLSKCSRCPKLPEQFEMMTHRRKLHHEVMHLKHMLSDEALSLLPDFHQRLVILRQLRYIDEDSSVLLKGRVACELNAVDELICTELVFENMLTPLSAEEVVALLSVLVFEQKVDDEIHLNDNLTAARKQLTELTAHLGEVQRVCGLPITPDEYVLTLHWGLAEVVYEWAKGTEFKEICKMTSVQEGSIVRSITRIDEVCREVRNCARVIGDTALYTKMEEASQKIKRDIVFAASLYVA